MPGRITALTLENFKAINAPIKIDLAPITLLFGQNSVGKSTIIQALHYLLGILENGNLDLDTSLWAGKTLDLGGFESIINGHDLSKTIKMRVDFVFDFDDLKVYTAPYKSYANCVGFGVISTQDIKTELSFFLEQSYIEIEIAYSNEIKEPYIKKFTSGFLGKKVAEIIYEPPSWSDRNDFGSLGIGILHSVEFDHDIFCDSVGNAPDSFLKNMVKGIFPEAFVAGSTGSGLVLESCAGLPIHWDSLFISGGYFEGFDGFEEPGIAGFNSDIRLGEKDLETVLTFESYMTQLTKGPCEILLSILKGMVCVGPLREIPDRNFLPKKSYDPSRWANGLAAWDKFYQSDQAFIDDLNYWLVDEERLNTNYKVELRRYRELNSSDDFWDTLTPDSKPTDISAALDSLRNISEKSELSIRDLRQNCTVHLHDMGIGISQVMPILVCAIHESVSFAAIEQPELHIHPGLQCRLADLLISASCMFLIETHSEHLLLRLLRRIRETTEGSLPTWLPELKPEKVSVNFIDFVDGKYKLRRLKISEDGDSEGEWPEGFFEERAGELF